MPPTTTLVSGCSGQYRSTHAFQRPQPLNRRLGPRPAAAGSEVDGVDVVAALGEVGRLVDGEGPEVEGLELGGEGEQWLVGARRRAREGGDVRRRRRRRPLLGGGVEEQAA